VVLGHQALGVVIPHLRDTERKRHEAYSPAELDLEVELLNSTIRALTYDLICLSADLVNRAVVSPVVEPWCPHVALPLPPRRGLVIRYAGCKQSHRHTEMGHNESCSITVKSYLIKPPQIVEAD
jgi:hypothetical protein